MKTMKVNNSKGLPFTVMIIDLLDAYHYADFFEDEKRYCVVGDNFTKYNGCVKLANRLFWALNPKDKTQEDWIKWDDGWDVRVYDKEYNCVYKAHEILPEKRE